ncbi:MAG: TonB protein [Stygiobacter sp.]|nr:MAG: TonB protein [Stygiobacter sp.]KAF0216445.1 MAG: TonB [Ignavibacteria bacterium]
MKTLVNNKTINSLLSVVFLFMLLVINAKGNNLYPGDEEYEIGIEKAPAAIGGNDAIMKKIVYPESAIKSKTEGKVYCLILINQSGDVDDVKIVKGLGNGCDEEAIRAVKKTKFTPGQNLGVNVKAKLAMAIQFKLP